MIKIQIMVVAWLLVAYGITSGQFNVYGKWEVYKAKPGEVAELTQKEALAKIGEVIFFNANSVRVFQDSCETVNLNVRNANANEYLFYNYRTYAATLAIDRKNIDILEVYCKGDSEPSYELILLNRDTLILPLYGFFFYLKKIPMG
jgi:hypothetical protein